MSVWFALWATPDGTGGISPVDVMGMLIFTVWGCGRE